MEHAPHEQWLRDIRTAMAKPDGLMLIVGPTGAGKTTLVHAAIAEINAQERNSISFEDPPSDECSR